MIVLSVYARKMEILDIFQHSKWISLIIKPLIQRIVIHIDNVILCKWNIFYFGNFSQNESTFLPDPSA